MTTMNETLAQRVCRTNENPETLGARWDPADVVYHFPDGSMGAWETLVAGAEQRDGHGHPVFHFRAVEG